MVREYKGSHSGEHGDGLVRSEFHEPMFGTRIVACLRGGQGRLRPDGPLQPRQDRAAAEDGRPQRSSASSRATDAKPRQRARLVGMGRLRRRRRDVQQQRRLPQIRPGRHVPVLSRHLRRAASDARPRQHAAPRPLRPARRRRAGLGRDARDDGAVHLVQGLQARMPDRRRHGADEDRVPAPVQKAPRPHPRDRLVAYLPRYAPYAAPLRAAAQPAQPHARARRARRAPFALSARAPIAEWSSDSIAAPPRRQPSPSREGEGRRTNPPPRRAGEGNGGRDLLLVDTFNRYFEPENARAAERVLTRAGYRVNDARTGLRRARSCCGRTFLAAGLVDEAERGAPHARRAGAASSLPACRSSASNPPAS